MVSSITSATVEAIPSAGFDRTRNPDKVQEFLTTAVIYIKEQNISDQIALRTLPLVLRGEAPTW